MKMTIKDKLINAVLSFILTFMMVSGAMAVMWLLLTLLF